MTLRGIPCKLSQTVQGNTTVERFFKYLVPEHKSNTGGPCGYAAGNMGTRLPILPDA